MRNMAQLAAKAGPRARMPIARTPKGRAFRISVGKMGNESLRKLQKEILSHFALSL